MYEAAIKNGSTEFITEESIGDYKLAGYESGKTYEMWQEIVKNYQNSWVLGMNQYRWKYDFQDYFNMVFHDFATLLNGSIERIALDGEVLYEQVDGKVLPVDKKERKQWQKNGYSL
jgi:hypothetical protein